ncbi:hypothetical protein GALL_524930 [mine drainage metagenome]|uniref:Uncharacterized protein n=1 Tax=mine drainage metagenome TaxID=410659 RepID=A0A1J5PDP5_9ZZZZ
MPAFARLPADDGFAGALLGDTLFFEAVFAVDFFGDFFFAAGAFLTAFLAFFFVPLLTFFARFFGAAGFTPRFDLPVCLRPFFLSAFFLAFATTISS